VPLSASVPDLLADLAAVLRALHLRWYVFGAQAAVLWGRPRFTGDVDVTVELSPENAMDLVEALRGGGFRLLISRDVEGFVARTRVLPFVHTRSSVPLDIVLAGPGLEEAFLDRAIAVPIGVVEIPFISPEDLIVTKVLAGRDKDLGDIRGILDERRERLDLAQIRQTLQLLEEGLGQSDLLRSFEQELANRRR